MSKWNSEILITKKGAWLTTVFIEDKSDGRTGRTVMKKLFILFIVVGLWAVAGSADALTWHINDNYIGYDPYYTSGYGVDSFGGNGYEVYSMDIDLTGSLMTVNINTNFFEEEHYQDYGDLFISTDGWHPFGTAPYLYDNFNTGEDWEFVLDVSSGYLYDISSETLRTNENPDGRLIPGDVRGVNWDVNWDLGETESYVDGHAVLVDPAGLTAVGQGSAERTADYYSLTFDLALLGVASNSFDLGFSWGETCANDMIQGGISYDAAVPTPEPATLLLMASGLLGVAGFQRARRKKS